jgi:hypothetical protein
MYFGYFVNMLPTQAYSKPATSSSFFLYNVIPVSQVEIFYFSLVHFLTHPSPLKNSASVFFYAI